MKQRIGFIGLGTMGLPMAKNIAKNGYALTVFDANQDRMSMLAGVQNIQQCSTLVELAQNSDVVITMLPTPEIVRNVASELFTAMRPGGIWIDMSTSDPDLTRSLAEQCTQIGLHAIDAPVARSSKDAEEGNLLVMVGGEKAIHDQVKPLLSNMASDILYCGPSGSGHVMKLVNNHLNITMLLLDMEALVLGVKSGLSYETMMRVFGKTAAYNRHLDSTLPWKALSRDFSPGFKLSLAEKDFGLIKQMARNANVPILFGSLARELMGMGIAEGYGEQDQTAVLKLLEGFAGVEVKMS